MVRGGAAVHSIHSKPNMKGCPLGRLSKDSIIGAIEEVRGRRQKEKEGEGEKEKERGRERLYYVCFMHNLNMLYIAFLYHFQFYVLISLS